MKELIKDSGSEKWYKLMRKVEGGATMEAGQLSMTVVFVS
jgi:hypothetical protein